MTTKAIGQYTALLGAFETTPGTAPADGYFKLPFVSSTVGGETPIIAADIRNGSREPFPGLPGFQDVQGDVVVPVDLNSAGFWLRSVFGAPTTTGTDDGSGGTVAPYSHVFLSGGSPAPITLEFGHTDIAKFRRSTFLLANSFNLSRRGDDNAQINWTIGFLGGAETEHGTPIDATPTTWPLKRMPVGAGLLTQAGNPVGSVVAMELTYQNNATLIRGFGEIEVHAQEAALTGSLTVRYDGTSLESTAGTGTPIMLTFTQAIDAGHSIAFQLHGTLNKPRTAVEGPGGIERTFTFTGCRQDNGGAMLTVMLVNDVASY